MIHKELKHPTLGNLTVLNHYYLNRKDVPKIKQGWYKIPEYAKQYMGTTRDIFFYVEGREIKAETQTYSSDYYGTSEKVKLFVARVIISKTEEFGIELPFIRSSYTLSNDIPLSSEFTFISVNKPEKLTNLEIIKNLIGLNKEFDSVKKELAELRTLITKIPTQPIYKEERKSKDEQDFEGWKERTLKNQYEQHKRDCQESNRREAKWRKDMEERELDKTMATFYRLLDR